MNFFDLMEDAFKGLSRVSKSVWIIGVLVCILSGGLIIQRTYDMDSFSDTLYDEYYDSDLEYSEAVDVLGGIPAFENSFMLGFILPVLIIALLIVFVIGFIIMLVSSIAYYYLYHNINRDLFENLKDKAKLGLVVKVNAIVLLKTVGATLLFVIPGIIVGLKYAPVNYVISENPNLTSSEILAKTRDLSKGYKWKIFVYNFCMTLLGVIFILLATPNTYISGYLWLDIISTLIEFVIMTFIIVYMGIFSVNLFNKIDKLRNTYISEDN